MPLIKSKHSRTGDGEDDEKQPSPPQEPQKNDLPHSGEDCNLTLKQSDNQVLLSVKSPSNGSKQPVSICCVVDISGSMIESASIQTHQGFNDLGYCVLDIVKHGLCTLIDNLDEKDSLLVVVFSEIGEKIIDLKSLDDTSKTQAKDKINRLSPKTMTNLWSGLEQGIHALQTHLSLCNAQQILVFTDGKPNFDPPRGIAPTLKRLYDKYPNPKPAITTLGFGYFLDTPLLASIARIGSSSFHFIPDSSFLGTIFINSIAAIQTTYAMNARIILKPLNKNSKLMISQINSGLNVVAMDGGQYAIELGNLLYDSQKDVIFREEINSQLIQDYSVELMYYKADKSKGEYVEKEIKVIQKSGQASELEISREIFRLEAVAALPKTEQDYIVSANVVDDLIKNIEKSKFKNDQFISALLADLKGQVTIAFREQKFFEKWGVHYLPALAMAHTHKICSNFKDPGVQPYAGKLFEELRDQIEATFLSKPPPQGTKGKQIFVNMERWEAYYDRSGPCFDGMGIVEMGDGSVKRVKDIKKGDKVYCPNSRKLETVKCVIQTDIQSQCLPLVRLNNQNGSDSGLLITPYHPVRIQGQWIFPHSLSLPQLQPCPAVYSFLLESGHSMSINGIECVTFAHGFSDNSVISHDYFGTDKIVKDLRWMKGWMAGHVKLSQEPVIRDSNSKIVIRLKNNRMWLENILSLTKTGFRPQNNLLNSFNQLKWIKKLIMKV